MLATKNFGVSGKQENTIAFHRWIVVKMSKSRRHGLNGKDANHRTQSNGMTNVDKDAMRSQTIGANVVTKAAARAALVVGWNSAM